MVKYCPKWGKETLDEDDFCVSCGFNFAKKSDDELQSQKLLKKSSFIKKYKISIIVIVALVIIIIGGFFTLSTFNSSVDPTTVGKMVIKVHADDDVNATLKIEEYSNIQENKMAHIMNLNLWGLKKIFQL